KIIGHNPRLTHLRPRPSRRAAHDNSRHRLKLELLPFNIIHRHIQPTLQNTRRSPALRQLLPPSLQKILLPFTLPHGPSQGHHQIIDEGEHEIGHRKLEDPYHFLVKKGRVEETGNILEYRSANQYSSQ